MILLSKRINWCFTRGFSSNSPELLRLYRENIALKAQVRALGLELQPFIGKKGRLALKTRAAQVFAYLLNRGFHDRIFEKYYQSASRKTIKRWLYRLKKGPWYKKEKRRKGRGGRNATPQVVVDLVIRFKKENGIWGAPRIQDELAKLGIKLCQPTIQKILREHGLDHRPKNNGPFDFARYRSKAKNMMWALDFFVVKTLKGIQLNVLLLIDLYTRELIGLKADDGMTTDSGWTMSIMNSCIYNLKRQPKIVIHDYGTQFEGQFKRQLRVLGIERRRTPQLAPQRI